jgi:hypothetical protein
MSFPEIKSHLGSVIPCIYANILKASVKLNFQFIVMEPLVYEIKN